MLPQLASAKVLAFSDLDAAISGEWTFQRITDASADGVGAEIKQEQRDGTIAPFIV